jgi:autotransporter-associated beta strand protein
MKLRIVALILSAGVAAHANIYSWSGGGATANWSDSGNWGFAGVPGNGDTVVFPAAQPRLSNTNNLAGLSLAQIRFAGTSGGYSIYGNAITVTSDIEATNTSGANAIYCGITFGPADVNVNVFTGAYLTLAGLLQGSAGLTKLGYGTLIYAYSGNNTYSGTTRVNVGTLQFNVGGANAYAGPLVIGDGEGTGSPVVQLLQSVEMPDTQPVTVNLNGLLDLNNFSDTVAALTIQGATVSTGAGLLALNGDLTVLGSGVEPMITGNLRFLGGMHMVNIADGPTFRDLDLYANVSDAGGGLLFTNSAPSGTFARLVGSNSFTGPLIVDNMTLSIETPTALGTTNSGTTVGSHGTLWLYSTGITNESLTMTAGATLYGQNNCVWNGPITLNGDVTIGCYPAISTLNLLGVISGSGGFTKTDVGTLELFGSSGNSYAGDTYIQSGTCLIDKASGTSIPGGTLTIGDHIGTFARVMDMNVGGNLGSSVSVAINEQGILDLNGQYEAVGPIALSGGTIATGSGRLTINGDIHVLATTNTATIGGSVLLSGGLRTITIEPTWIYPSLVIPAAVADNGGGFQVVEGASSGGYDDMSLQGSNSFTGPLIINNTLVSAEAPWALGATSGGTFVTNSGILWIYQTAITNESVTLSSGATIYGQNNCIWNGPINLLGDATIYNPSPPGFLFDIQGAISGTGNLMVRGSIGTGASNRFSGTLANTYTGTTTVYFTTLLLAKTPIGGAIPNNLVINQSSTVRLANDWQLDSPTKVVTIGDNGLFDLAGHTDWVGPVGLQGAQITSGSGLLYLGGDITVSNSTTATSLITGNASLWNGTKTINCVGHNYSPDIRISANLGGNGSSGIIKAGTGEASLSGTTNTFPGPVTVNAGTLWAEADSALGNTNTVATVNSGADLFLKGNVAIGLKPLSLNGTGGGLGALSGSFGNSHWAGNITLATDSMIVVATNASMELSGVISGPGNFTKSGWGNLILDGASSNSFTGTTLVQQGPLTLSKTNGPAISGSLTIGLGLDGAIGDVVQTLMSNQLSSNNLVSISSSGLLDLSSVSSFNTTVGSLVGVGPVQIGANSLICGSDNTSTNYSGSIYGTASGSLLKVGSGAWTLAGTSPFAGIMQVQAGKLFVNGSMSSAVASFINGSLLGGSGTIGPIGFNHGVLAPGNNGPGILNISSSGVTLNNNDTFLVAISGTTAGSGYSQLYVIGTVNLGNASLQLNMPVIGATNSQLTIINNDGTDAITGTFLGLAEGSTVTAPNGAKFKISYHGGSGNDVVLTQLSLPTVPAFTTINKLGGGGMQLNALGMSNLTYTVQAETDLKANNWDTIGTATADGAGVIHFTDLSAVNYQNRFYRLSWP